MMEIKKFVELMTGEFDNKEQFMEMKEAGKSFPYAQHINTVCNDKIKNIPEEVIMKQMENVMRHHIYF